MNEPSIEEVCSMCFDEIEKLREQKQKAILLIKDGRFVEALKVLEDG